MWDYITVGHQCQPPILLYVLCLSRDYLTVLTEKHSHLETWRWAITFEGRDSWGSIQGEWTI